MAPIEYKLALDEKGTIKGVELWQGSHYITISLEAHGLHESGYRWIDVQKQLKALQEVAQAQTEKSLVGLHEYTKQVTEKQ